MNQDSPSGSAALPLTQAGRVDQVCTQFELAWRGPSRPRVEDFIDAAPEPVRLVLLREPILLDVEYRRAAGDNCQAEDYQARFPQLDPDWLAGAMATHATMAPDGAPLSTPPGESGAAIGEYVPGRPHARQGLRYRILRPHAKGGLGEVFVAEDQELHREVALKEIRREYAAHAASRSRFLREAEITGALEHPGIVPVYGLGCYFDHRPFYAMRFIKGVSLWEAIQHFHAADEAARDPGGRSLAFRELLGRFVDACNALAYAHARGILHRDVKPHNIMLGKYGETLVVDWGLAKVIGHPEGRAGSEEGTLRPLSGADTPPTQAGDVLGTPAYMSPEQAAGQLESLGPASDIYSLGATLYELLTGTKPVQGQQAGDVLAKVKLRTWLTSRQITPGLPRGRALEAICLKAMAHPPENRYATALQLAADVKSWLADEPVAAYPEPWLAKWGRWGRRHRAVLAAAGALLLTAVVALTVSTVLIRQREQEAQAARKLAEQQRDRADDNLRLAREAVDNTVWKIADNTALKQANFHHLRRELLESMLPFYEKFVQQRQNDPESQAERGRAWGSLANLRDELGDKESARSDYEQMRAIFVQVAEEFPAVPQYRFALGRSHNSLGNMLRDLGKLAEAETAYRQALKIRMQLAEEFPAVPEYRREVGSSHHNLGMVLWDLGKRIESDTAYCEALKIRMQLAEGFSAVALYRTDLAATHHMLGDLLHDLGRWAEAETAYRQALKIKAQLAEEFPAVPQYRWELAGSHNNLGHALRGLGKSGEAESTHRQARKIWMQLAEEFPAVPQYRRDVAASHHELGSRLRDLGQRTEAETAYRQALKIYAQLVQDSPAVPQYRRELAASYHDLGVLLYDPGDGHTRGVIPVDPGRLAEAENAFREARKIWMQLAEKFPAVPDYRRDLAASHHALGNLLRDLGRRTEAEALTTKH